MVEYRGRRIVAGLLALTAVLTVAFWVTFFADYAGQAESYFARECAGWFLWERSFPAADLWVATACLIGAAGLWKRRRLSQLNHRHRCSREAVDLRVASAC
jgi:hypothetical protein